MNRRRILPTLALLAAALPAAAQSGSVPSTPDSRETREALYRILDRVPPELGMVLKLDPSLVGNQAYLAPYPELGSFLAEHPEIAAHPSYYLEDVALPPPRIDVDSPRRMVMDILGASAALIGFLAVTFTLAWLVKSLMAQRRWSHLVRVQTEAHNKLLDRLGSNEELLAYIQSPAGRRFLESAPIQLEEAHPSPRAPISRLLWSVQAGLVLVAGGIGLQFVSTGVPPGGAEPLAALGILAIAVGVGFVLSAIVAFVITRRLGLWAPAEVGADRSGGA